jgi:hypothetical protein
VAKKKVTKKKVTKKKTAKPKITEVKVSGGENGLKVESAPAIVEEPTMKVVEQGHATYYTESEYRKKFG